MSQQSVVSVIVDDRIRLLSAALAGTSFPQVSQDRKRYHAHAHARSTMKYLADQGMQQHAAIQTLQQLLDTGSSLESLFSYMLQLEWPGLKAQAPVRGIPDVWHSQLWDFYQDAGLAAHWASAQSAWDNAAYQSRRVFSEIHFKAFMQPFVGEIPEELVFMPNICYPADQEIGLRVGSQLIAIVPPPQAWGDSPPWPYDDDSMLTYSYRSALSQYASLALHRYLQQHSEEVAEATRKDLPISEHLKAQHPTWQDQFVALFMSAAIAMYLEDYVSETDAKSYILMEKKVRGMTILPGTISVLRRYQQEYGNRYHRLVDFLPVFPAQLRVAKKIVTM